MSDLARDLLTGLRRVSVVGCSGAGKTTLARELADALGAEHVELDSIFHQPGWTPLPTGEFRRRVAERCEADAWVACGNYSAVQDLVWQRAEAVIVLDLPKPLVMTRVVRRTLVRCARREELWNGNRESFRNALALRDRQRSLIRWTWDMHAAYRDRYRSAATDPAWARLPFVFLTSRREVRRFGQTLRLLSPQQ